MSSRDYTTYASELASLAGRRCSVTLALNSLKLHIDENKKDGPYLWIDPPWQFGLQNTLIEEAWGCPHWEEDNYRERFKAWCERFAPIYDSEILSAEALPDGQLQVKFLGGYRLFVAADQTPGDHENYWYDHWYLRLTPREPDGIS